MEQETSQYGNQQQTKGTRHGIVNNMTALHHSITAQTRNGDLVEIVALGDVEGFSPACWVISTRGEIDLAPTNRFTVVDPNALPPSRQAWQNTQQPQFGSSKY